MARGADGGSARTRILALRDYVGLPPGAHDLGVSLLDALEAHAEAADRERTLYIPLVGALAEHGAMVVAVTGAAALSSLLIASAWLLYRPLVAIALVGFAIAIVVVARITAGRARGEPPEAPTSRRHASRHGRGDRAGSRIDRQDPGGKRRGRTRC